MLEKKDQIEEHFWLLVSLKLAGEATPGDLSELESLLKTHPEWTLRMELFTNIWQQKHQKTGDENGEKTSETRETHFNRHLQRLNTHLANPVTGLAGRDPGFANFKKGRDEFMPIPQLDLDINPNLKQNPGY